MNVANPTDPGPFQKYLFSAASYVQVGECYRGMLEHWDLIRQTAESAKLQEQLTAVWQEAFERQMALGTALIQSADEAGMTQLAGNLQAIQAQARQVGQEVMHDLIRALGQGQEDAPDFDAFFHAWASACDRAYAELMRTEVFALILAQIINSGIGPGGADQDS